MKTNLLSVDGARLWDTLMRSGEIGPGRTTGLNRPALCTADGEMRDQFVTWCRDAGLAVSIDKVGNIFARRKGSENDLPPVALGSHLDTQIAGGKYDGILGVLSGLEIVRTLNDRGMTTRRPIEVVCWTNEEGARFPPPMMGAGTFAGLHELDWVLGQKDDDGLLFGDELERIGYAGDAPVPGHELDSYFELHIEQGPVLDAEGVPVGIVAGGFVAFGSQVQFHGETAHSGPTPMEKRRNALVGAAYLIGAVNDIGWKYEPDARSTTSRIQLWPNKYGILPDWAEVTVDIRHPDRETAQNMANEVREAIDESARKARVDVEVVKEWEFGCDDFSPECIDLLREKADELGIGYKELLSQAGHDAYHIARVAPTAMIFSPCKDGITHNENEEIEIDATVPAVNLLMHAVIERANRS